MTPNSNSKAEASESTSTRGREAVDSGRLSPSKPAEEAEQTDIERLERVIEKMRAAEQRMAESDGGRETQALQAQVLNELESLLKDAEQASRAPREQGGSSNSGAGRNGNEAREQAADGSGRSRGNALGRRGQRRVGETMGGTGQPAGSGPAGGQPGATALSPATNERGEPAAVQPVEASEQLRAVKETWGHLPQTTRDELQNIFSEKYLPKYEDQVRRYYESLAQKIRRKKRE